MEQIRFLKGANIVYDGNINVRGNIVSITFDSAIPSEEILTSGFELLNEHNGRVQGRYCDYTTLYRKYEYNDSLYELSNNGSVYTPYVPTVIFTSHFGGTLDGVIQQKVGNYEELIIPTPVARDNYKFVAWNPEIPVSGEITKDVSFRAEFTYVPTEEEMREIFEQNKANKIAESKLMLETHLETNPIKSTCHNGVEGTYTVTSEKQTLMSNNYLTYMIAKQAGSPIELTWNETGKECEVWTEAEFLQLIMEVQAFVKPLVYLQQRYEVMINACETQEALDSIVITYCLE